MICDRFKKVNDIHNINLHTLGSFCDFEPGYSPEGSSSISFLEDSKTYVIMDSKSNYHHFLLNLMMPALMVLEEVSHEGLHFVLCNLNFRPEKENFDNLLIELLQERNISYTQVDNSEFTYLNAKNFIAINGADLEIGIPLLYNYFLSKYNVVTETPKKKIYISRKNYPSPDTRVDNEEILENYFIEKGFQVVYPENIPTFKEQFELFNSCSTLAALSGSGLTSLMFLQENQKVIEILTEVMVGQTMSDDQTKTIIYGIHEHYEEFSFLKKHRYLSVLNMEKQAELVKAKLDELVFSSEQNS
jgi:capsular polysaccharide biosynthesis protein